MKKPYLILFLWAALACGLSRAATPSSGPPGSGDVFSEVKWKDVIAQFERSVFTLSEWLGKTQAEKKRLHSEIEALEQKTAALRKNTTHVPSES